MLATAQQRAIKIKNIHTRCGIFFIYLQIAFVPNQLQMAYGDLAEAEGGCEVSQCARGRAMMRLVENQALNGAANRPSKRN
jgi:hypothetical protein